MDSKNIYPFPKAISLMLAVTFFLIAGAVAHLGWAHYDQDSTLEFSDLLSLLLWADVITCGRLIAYV